MKKWFLKNYKNYLCLFFAIILLSFASVFFDYSDFGSDSIFALNDGLATKTGLSLGNTNLIIGATSFLILVIIDRKSIGVGTFVMALTMGLCIDIVIKLNIVPKLSNYEMHFILKYTLKLFYVLFAITIGGFGIALYIYANRGISPLEGILMKITKVTKMPFWLVKIINDIIFYTVGIILGATFNVGSIIAAFTYGPVISMFSKMLAKSGFLKEKNENEDKNKKTSKKSNKR